MDSNGTNMYMPVAPAYGNGGLFGGDMNGGWWVILLILLLGGGLWGGFGGMGGFGMMNAGMDYLYPWLNNSQHISDGFRDQQLQTSIGALQNSVTAGFGDVQTALCGGFAGVNAGIANGFAQAEIAANGRQMANMQQQFAGQTAVLQGFNGVGTGIADLKYTVAAENCADRAAVTSALQELTGLINARFNQAEMQRFQDKVDAKNDEIAQLRQEVLYARGQASQIAQNQQVIDGIYNRLDTCPVGTTPVYGRTPIFTCNNGGCGCNAAFAN